MTSWKNRDEGWWTRRLADEPEYLRPLSLGDPDLELFLAAHQPR
jgi:hypothetical protein